MISIDLESDIKSIWIGSLLIVFGEGLFGVSIFKSDKETEIIGFFK